MTNYESIFGAATVLRTLLIWLYSAKQSSIGKDEKLEVMWRYVTGTQFKQRVESLHGIFSSMQKNLNKEKSVMTALWAEKEKEIEKVVLNISGMYGDLQELTDGLMPAIQALELPLLEEAIEEA